MNLYKIYYLKSFVKICNILKILNDPNSMIRNCLWITTKSWGNIFLIYNTDEIS